MSAYMAEFGKVRSSRGIVLMSAYMAEFGKVRSSRARGHSPKRYIGIIEVLGLFYQVTCMVRNRVG